MIIRAKPYKCHFSRPLTFGCVESVLGVWIDFDQQRILFDEQRVHVAQQLHDLILNVGQTELGRDSLALIRLQTFNNVNRLVDDGVGILGGHILNVNTTLRRGNDDWTLGISKYD